MDKEKNTGKDKSFYVRDVTKITGVKRLRLHMWIEKGYIKPSIQGGQGTGTPNEFSRNDLYKIELFKKFVEGGFSRDLASSYLLIYTDKAWDKHGVFSKIEEDVFSSDRYRYLIFFRENNVIMDSMVIIDDLHENQLMAKFQEFDMDDCFIINLMKIRKKIDSKIAGLNI